MPTGMILKSEPYASDLSAPTSGFLAGDYCRAADEEYHDRVVPLSREQFIAYGDWFANQLVPDINETEVDSLSRTSEGFIIRTAQQECFTARKVVVATGVIPFAFIPPELANMPCDLVAHSSLLRDARRFSGKEVLVVGSGQSALESAALLHECGSNVKVLVRADEVRWNAPNPSSLTWIQQIRRPVVRLCEGWHCWAYDRLPDAFRMFPKAWRIEHGLGFLGPSGAWWLRDRVENRLPLLTGHRVLSAEAHGERVRLNLRTPEGPAVAEADHVIAGTGFRLDLDRLTYLDPAIRSAMTIAGGAPVLDRNLESSVPGLFFTGAMAAPSLGPVTRFVAGTHVTAPRVARRIHSSLRRTAIRSTAQANRARQADGID
jgi:thioredoxin reductase